MLPELSYAKTQFQKKPGLDSFMYLKDLSRLEKLKIETIISDVFFLQLAGMWWRIEGSLTGFCQSFAVPRRVEHQSQCSLSSKEVKRQVCLARRKVLETIPRPKKQTFCLVKKIRGVLPCGNMLTPVLGHQHEAGQQGVHNQVDLLPRKEDQRCPASSCTV